MKVWQDAGFGGTPPWPTSAGAVGTIGNYDGVHRGQQAILAEVVDRAQALGVPATVVTFSPHPMKVLRPEALPARITTNDQKQRMLRESGIDQLCIVRFDTQFAETQADEFVRNFLFGVLNLREIFVGSRFAFGQNRAGDLSLLEQLALQANRKAFGVQEVLQDGAPISSTRVRTAVSRGDVEEAERLLGRFFSVEGLIVRGAGKGHELGFPTANLATANEILPQNGVYLTLARLAGEDTPRPGVANVGLRPTLHDQVEPTVECHLLDFEGDLYGSALELSFVRRLRGEQAFDSVEALVDQIGRDVRSARAYFQTSGRTADGP